MSSIELDGAPSSERRQSPRVMVAVPFRLYSWDARLLLTARTLDLSTAGALVHGLCHAQVGQAVRVEVGRGKARNPLSLEATVVRFARPEQPSGNHGVAVRFEGISPIDEAVLGRIIRDARR